MTIKQTGKRSFGQRKNRINEQITHPNVRLIGLDGKQVGIVSIDEAIKVAEQESLDLVEISPDSDPPVCRVMDYGKFLFDEKKKRTEAKKRQKQVQIKEIKIRPVTEQNDYQVKLRSLKRFLESGDKAKVTVKFKGREVAHQEFGMEILKRIENDLHDCGVVEQEAKREGRQIMMVLAPKKK